MSISSEITRIINNIAAAYTAASNKGATIPQAQTSANLATCIGSITTGGGGGSGNYEHVLTIENIMYGGTAETENSAVSAACNDISQFLFGTNNS